MIRILDGTDTRHFASELDKWKCYYNEDPWYAAYEMPTAFLTLFPDAREFMVARKLINAFLLNAGRKNEKFLFALKGFPSDLSKRLYGLFNEYECVGANHSTASGDHLLPSSSEGLLIEYPIGIEFEPDNDQRFDIRTFPTHHIWALATYMGVVKKMLCELDYEEYLPLGYEMNAHINVGIRLCPKNSWILEEEEETVFLADSKCIFARDYQSNQYAQNSSEYLQQGQEVDLDEDAIEEILADIQQEERLESEQDNQASKDYEKLNFVAQSVCCLLLMPNISQARLEHIRDISFGMFSEDLCGLANWRVDLGYSHRAHIVYVEISPTLDIPYFVFSSGMVCKVLNAMNRESARRLLGKLIRIYCKYALENGSRSVSVEGYIDGYILHANNLKWVAYHNMTFRLRKEIVKSFSRDKVKGKKS